MIDLEKMAKEHEALFPLASPESQFHKMEEEISELEQACDFVQEIKETSDIVIVCFGLYRWFPKTALAIYNQYVKRYTDYGRQEEIEKQVLKKWQINLKRKWEWNGKTYHHVGVDGHE